MPRIPPPHPEHGSPQPGSPWWDTPNTRLWSEHRTLQRTVVIVWGAWFPVVGILIPLPREWSVRLVGPLFVVGSGWGIVSAFLALGPIS